MCLEEKLISISTNEYVKKGNFLLKQGEECNNLFIIHSGSIKISQITSEGQEITLEIATRGEVIGDTTLFSDDVIISMLNAKTLEECWIGRIDKKQLEQELLSNHNLLKEYISWINERHLKSQSKIRDLILHGKKGALYSTLIRMTNSYGVVKPNGIFINIPLTNQILSEFCGTSREGINRMLSDLKEKEIISIEHKYITVHNVDYLKKEINCDNCPFEICQI